MTVDQITKAALSLPNDARARLADQLVESLDPAEEGPLQRVWTAEALRRLEEVRSGKVKTIPGREGIEQVRRALRNRISSRGTVRIQRGGKLLRKLPVATGATFYRFDRERNSADLRGTAAVAGAD